MDREQLRRAIEQLTDQLYDAPHPAELYVARGKHYYQLGEFDKALNDFIKARQSEPGNVEAAGYIKLITEIFEFRYKDLYNP